MLRERRVRFRTQVEKAIKVPERVRKESATDHSSGGFSNREVLITSPRITYKS